MNPSKRSAVSVIVLSLGLMAAVPVAASAQEGKRLEIFVGYSHLLNERATNADVATVNGLTPAQVKALLGVDITTNTGRAGLSGLHSTVTAYLTRRLGLTGDFASNFKTENEVLFGMQGSAKMRAFQFLGGPQLRFTNRSRVTPFVRGLVGAARLNATYKNPVATFVDNNTAFSMTLGGGLDVRINERVGARVLQVDYNSIALPERRVIDSSGVPFELHDVRRQNIRLSFGVVLR